MSEEAHREHQLDVLLEKFSKDPIEFESRSDILSLEEVLEALDAVKALPPLAALLGILRRIPWSRIEATVRRFLASNENREIDEFGLDQAFLRPLLPLAEWMHDHYFRVESTGLENIPSTGRAMLVANHSGALPYDGTMVVASVRLRHPAARNVRVLVEDFIYHLPFMGMFMSRVGAVRACQENALRLLENDELTLVFPEGVKGVGKLYSKRYQLQRFGRGGAIRLAAQAQAPMIPTAIVGAEESMPLISKVSWLARPLGLPYIPITPTLPLLGPLGLIPLPTKWSIDYGTPIDLSEYDPEALLRDRVTINRINEELRATIQALVDARRRQRPSAFWA